MSDTYINEEKNEIEQNDTATENVQDDGEIKEEHHHTHNGQRHHLEGHHSHHRKSHHRSSKHGSKSRRYRESSSSELERIGHSVIYESAKKDKIKMFIKRFFFCAVVFVFISFVFASILNPDFLTQFTSIGGRSDEKEINELKIKIIQYEDKIEELEEIIEKYEKGELPE